MVLKKQLERVDYWFEQLTKREKFMVIGAAIAVTLYVGLIMLVNPVVIKQTTLSQSIGTQREQLTELEKQVADVKGQDNSKQVKDLENEIITTDRQIAAYQLRLETAGSKLIKPTDMPTILHRLLRDQPKVQLLSAKTGSGLEQETANVDGIYKHSITVELRGPYLSLLAYITALENEASNLLWGSMQLKVVENNECVLSFVVYTLSNDKQWLRL